MSKEIISGAEIVIRFLQDYGVKHIFGYPGGAVLHIYDEIYKQNKFQHILTRHEQAAVHAADGYARTTGQAGVAIVTSGPGATNAVTGIATAYMDSIPLVVISGQVPVPLIGNDAFQEVDTVGITRPCVKHNYLVTNVEDLSRILAEAFYIAVSGRPGPVVVDIPKDVTAYKTEYQFFENISIPSYVTDFPIDNSLIKQAASKLLSAKQPIFYTGGGVILGDGSDELIELIKTLNAPITNTSMGLGGYPGTDKQFIGMLGMHGTYEANMAMHECDVMVAVGARFDDRVTGNIEKFCPDAYIIHIDIDPTSISKNITVNLAIIGQLKIVLAALDLEINQTANKIPDISNWWQKINKWRDFNCLKFSQSTKSIKPQQTIQTLYEVTKGDAYIAADVGQHQMWAAQYYKFDLPRRWVNSGGLGTMGFGFPAAMGIKIAHPDANVWTIAGDGGIQMNIQELATCMEYKIPVKILIINNGYLGMVRQWQEFFYNERYAESTMSFQPDFVKLAESYGHIGLKVEKLADLKPSLTKANKMLDRLVIIDVHVEKTENVYPMVPAGAGLNEMILV